MPASRRRSREEFPIEAAAAALSSPFQSKLGVAAAAVAGAAMFLGDGARSSALRVATAPGGPAWPARESAALVLRGRFSAGFAVPLRASQTITGFDASIGGGSRREPVAM